MLEIIYKTNEVIINPLIILLFGIALIVFLWGVVDFIASTSSDEGRQRGKRNILWGIIGLFIMFAVFGIIKVILGTFGIEPPPGEIIP